MDVPNGWCSMCTYIFLLVANLQMLMCCMWCSLCCMHEINHNFTHTEHEQLACVIIVIIINSVVVLLILHLNEIQISFQMFWRLSGANIVLRWSYSTRINFWSIQIELLILDWVLFNHYTMRKWWLAKLRLCISLCRLLNVIFLVFSFISRFDIYYFQTDGTQLWLQKKQNNKIMSPVSTATTRKFA